MTLSELVAACYLKSTGKVSSLTSTDTKWIKITAIANQYIAQWQNTKGVDWNSLYDNAYSIGTVTATAVFDLDDEIRKLSDSRGDFVQIIATDDTIYDYEIVQADALKTYDKTSRVCAQIGRTLVFPEAFVATDALLGATIYVPVYLFAETLTNSSDVVPVDIPEWLVLMTAAEYVRNDITKQGQYPNLVQEANGLLERMIDDNDAQVNDVFAGWSPIARTW